MAQMLTPGGQPVEVPDDQVHAVFLGGGAGFAPGSRVPVTAPDGTPGTIDPTEAAQAFQNGYKFDPAAVQDATNQAKYGGTGQQILTGLESTAAGATLGLSTAAERALGVKAEDIAGRRAANPMTHEIGEVIGTVAPLLLPGVSEAEGLGEVATRLATAPMRGVSAAGKATTEAIAGLLAPGGTSAISRAIAATLPMAAGSVVEGTLFGLGQVIDESALHRDGDPELTAEHVLATIGTNALLGGVIGTGTRALALGAQALPFRAKMETAMRRFFGGNAAKEAEFRALLMRQEQEAAEGGAAPLGAATPAPGEAAPPLGTEPAPQAAEGVAGVPPEGMAGAQTTFSGTMTPGAPPLGPNGIASGVAGGMTQPATLVEQAGADVDARTLAALMRTGAPLDGALPLITRSRGMQGLYDAAGRNPEAADLIRTAQEKTLGGVEDFHAENLARIGDAGLTHEEVGLGAQRAVQAAEKTAQTTQRAEEAAWRRYMGVNADLADQTAGRRIIPAPEVVSYLRPFVELEERGGPKTPAAFKQLYNTLMEAGQAGDLDVLRAWRTEAFGNSNFEKYGDADSGQWKGLAGAITGSFDRASQASGPKALAAWNRLNGNWQSWMERAPILRQIANAPDGGAAYRAMVTRDGNWLTRMRTLRDLLPAGDMDNFTARYLKDLSTDPKTGALNLNRWQTQWTALQPEERAALVAPGTAPRQGLDDLLTLAQAAQRSNYLRNWSNTASATLFQDQLTGGGTAKIVQALKSSQGIQGLAESWLVDKLGRRLTLTPADQARMMTNPDFIGQAFANPSAQKLADLERTVQASEGRLSKAVKVLTQRPFFSRTAPIALAADAFRAMNETPQQAYTRRWGQLEELDRSPDILGQRIVQTTGDLPHVAPDTSFLTQAKAAQIVQFLTQKAPRNPNGPTDPLIQRAWQPSDGDVLRWGRFWEAANDPIGVIEAAGQGRLSREGVETLRTVYPKLYALTVKTLIQQLSEGAEARAKTDAGPLPYRTRVQLGLLLSAPLDPGWQPQAIAAAQARFNPGGQSGAPPSGASAPTSPSGGSGRTRKVDKVGFVGNEQTDTERLASRG